MTASTDHNLLFGILALQMDLISRDELIEGMSAWVVAKDRSLSELLVKRGWLDAESEDAIERLVQKRIEKHDGNAQRTLASLATVSPILRNDIAALRDSDIQASLARVGTAAHPEAAHVPVATQAYAGSPTSDGRFAILRLHDKGGLGEVFVAKDCELNRQVALKQIQDRFADDVNSRLRFCLEAEVTGCLEHPGIVPVYGFGESEAGRPYYAMRFIHGESMAKRIDAHHGVGQRAGTEHTLDFRKLLGQFIDVCEAVDYAHSRGVIHRDLKPSNVMVGRFGETLVVDWGLAKPLGSPDDEGDVSDLPLLVPSSGSSATEMGSAIGTPAYMSPEQAAGRLDQIGTRSDVYSLGATLYHIVSGKAPFDGQSHQILEKVRNGDFLRPRECNRQVSPALEAICLKAMQREPKDRYASARELATELDRWLADEPVLAWPEPLSLRLKRTVKRHRVAVTSVAAALLVALISLAVGLGIVSDKNRQLRKTALRADSNFRQAKGVVDDFLTQVSDSTELLRGTPGTQQLRTTLLEMASVYYEGFIRQNQSAQLQEELGAAYLRLAKVHREIGMTDKAAEEVQKAVDVLDKAVGRHSAPEYRANLVNAYTTLGLAKFGAAPSRGEQLLRKAIDLGEKLVQEHPSLPEFEEELAHACGVLGVQYQRDGRLNEAIVNGERALDIRERLVRHYPTVPRYQENLINDYKATGVLYQNLGRMDDAESRLKKALAAAKRLFQTHPFPQYQSSLASTHSQIGSLFRQIGKRDAAFEQYKQSLEIQEQLVDENPTVPSYRSGLAAEYANLAGLNAALGIREAAVQQYQKAIQIQKGLAEQTKPSPNSLAALANSYKKIAALYYQMGELDEAVRQSIAAVEIGEQLVEKHPSIVVYRDHLAGTYSNLGAFYLRLGQNDAAAAQFQRAIEIQEQLVEENPTIPGYKSDLADSYNNLGVLYRSTGEREDEARELQKAIDIKQQLVDANPTVTDYKLGLAIGYINLGKLHRSTGKPKRAAKELQKAIEIYEQLVEQEPTIPDYRYRLAGAIGDLGDLRNETDERNAALVHVHKAIEILESVVEENPSVPSYLRLLSANYNQLGNLLHLTVETRDEAEQYYIMANEIQERLVEQNPTVPSYQDALAKGYGNLGVFYGRLGKHSAALEHVQKAIDILERLAEENPTVPNYKHDLARKHMQLGLVTTWGGNVGMARRHHNMAIDIWEQLAEQDPEAGKYPSNIATSHAELGRLERSTGKPKAAAEHFDKAVGILERLVRKNPSASAFFKSRLAFAYNERAWWRATSRIDAVRDGQQAVQDATRACQLSGWRVPAYLDTLAAAYAESKNFAQAVTNLQKALDMTADVEKPVYERRLQLYKSGQPYREPDVK